MCVRTTTTYECGHVFKSVSDCYSSACPGVDKCRCEKVGDCRDCRSESANLSRGKDREGKIRYKIRKSQTGYRSNSSSEETLFAEYGTSSGASPWAPQVGQEKTWESPHRKRADEAWLSEHEDRISDLQERLGKVRVTEGKSKPKYPKDDYDYDGYGQDEYDFIEDAPPKNELQVVVRRNPTTRMERCDPGHRQDRQHSHDSLPDSMPSYRSSPKLRQASVFSAVDAYPEATYEYDYYNNNNTTASTKPPHYSHKRHYQGHHRSKTDPYLHSNFHRRDSGYEIEPVPPPLQMPIPAPTGYEYYSPNASPSGAQYTLADYHYSMSHPPPASRPPYYPAYRRH